MTWDQVVAAATHYSDWVRIDPAHPEDITTVPDLTDAISEMHPGESATLRVRRDADAATLTLGRVRDGGWLFGFQVDPTPPAGLDFTRPLTGQHKADRDALRRNLEAQS